MQRPNFFLFFLIVDSFILFRFYIPYHRLSIWIIRISDKIYKHTLIYTLNDGLWDLQTTSSNIQPQNISIEKKKEM